MYDTVSVLGRLVKKINVQKNVYHIFSKNFKTTKITRLKKYKYFQYS